MLQNSLSRTSTRLLQFERHTINSILLCAITFSAYTFLNVHVSCAIFMRNIHASEICMLSVRWWIDRRIDILIPSVYGYCIFSDTVYGLQEMNSRNKSILKTTHNIVFISNTIILFLGLLYVLSLYFKSMIYTIHTMEHIKNNQLSSVYLYNKIYILLLIALCCYFSSTPCVHILELPNICTI